MRKLAIFSGGYAGAVFAAVLFFPEPDRLRVGIVLAVAAVLLALLRRVLPDRTRRRALLCCVGAALGMLWTSGYDRLILDPVRKVDDTTVQLTASVTGWAESTDYGVRIPVRAQLPDGRQAAAFLYMSEENMDGGGTQLRPGDQVTTVAHLKFSGENGWDEQITYNLSKGVLLTATAYGKVQYQRPEHPPISTLPAYAMNRLQQGISTACSGQTEALVRAVVTGDKQLMDPLLTSGLRRTGLSHTVAVSGMHLSFLAGILTLLLGRGRRTTAVVTALVMFFFCLMVGGTPSAARAAVMVFVLQSAPLLGREGDTPTALTFALFLLLVHNPFAAADIGLQLSFAAVAGIALFTENLQKRFNEAVEKKYEGKRLVCWALRCCGGVLAVTLGALVFTVPLSALYFDTISLVAPVANLLCVWAVSGIFCLGLCTGVLGIFLPAAAAAVGGLIAPLVLYFRVAVIALAKLPYAAIPAGPELYRLWLVFAYLLVAMALLLPGRKRFWLPCGAAALTLSVAIFCTTQTVQPIPLRVEVLDVGQGQSVLLRSNDSFALVDCGGDSYENPGDIAADQLQSYGSSELDLLVISHYHEDHANGIPELLERVAVKQIALPDAQEDSKLRKQILEQAQQADIPVIFIRETDRLTLGDAQLTIWPPFGKTDANELGLTVLCTAGDYDVLMTGDMDSGCERLLADSAGLPDIELMVAGHHGSKYSNSSYLLERVRPEDVVISVGAYNRYGHPTQEAMDRFRDVGAQLYRTDRVGTVTITLDGLKKGA